MRYTSLIYGLFLWAMGLMVGFSSSALAAALTPLEQVQVFACRTTSSLLLFRGEGFQTGHQKRFDSDLLALENAFQAVSKPSAALRTSHQELVTQLRNGVSYGPKEEDMPWRYPQELSKSLREFLFAAYSQAQSPATDELPAKVEYLAVQYLYRSYMGNFEIAREHGEQYLGQDERLLVPSIDAQLGSLTAKDPASVDKLRTRWGYLKNALSDLNSQSSALVSASGRPFAPTTVDRHTRAFSNQWLALKK
ncbi:MAG: hypothetical protein ABWY06_17470 [Pseudomonas sp.]|uniref:hypothetical protein n=1 Tax=Pseudomonas sp. TaxID=306 RepID=UPI003393C655